jgi:hypothetical protein
MRAAIGACGAAFFLASCTLQNIQDPQFGMLSGEHVLPGLLKSIKCELLTFYTANGARRHDLDVIRNGLRGHPKPTIHLEQVLEHKYFDLDTEAYGAYVLESKVVDNIGLPGTNSSFANQLQAFPAHAQVFTVAPTLSSQGTYDMNYNFAIQQNENLLDLKQISEDQVPDTNDEGADEMSRSPLCYSEIVRGHYDDLARGKYPTLQRFKRLWVDGDLPLAAWLQYNTTIMGVSRNILADAAAAAAMKTPVPVATRYLNEGVDGGQMSYFFTVQYTAGVDAKFSLLSSRWNTLAADLMASAVQTGELSVYVNGYLAAGALNAKGGLTLFGPPATPAPIPVYNVPKPQPNGGAEERSLAPGAGPRAPSNRGYFLYPPAALPSGP